MVQHLPTQEIPCCSGIWSFLLDYILNLPHPIPHLHTVCLRTIVILHLDLLSVFLCNFCLNSFIHLPSPLIMQHALSISLPHIGEISPTRCNNCVFYSQWLYSTCFGWQFHPSSGVQCCIWPYTALYSWWWVRLSPETCRVKPLRIKNAIVASCWTYFTT